MNVHVNIKVRGRVQGVFYRASTKDKARALGLKGFVKNIADGSVYIEAEGPSEKIAELIIWCKQGSPASKVTNVQVDDATIQNLSAFKIIY